MLMNDLNVLVFLRWFMRCLNTPSSHYFGCRGLMVGLVMEGFRFILSIWEYLAERMEVVGLPREFRKEIVTDYGMYEELIYYYD